MPEPQGAPVAVTRRGTGTAVVLIHGVGMRAGFWAPQLAALSADYDVVAYDLLGHGRSPAPPADAQLADFAVQLQVLLDSLGIAKAHLVGHSLGALVALEFALTHPQRVHGVVAMNAVFCRTPAQRTAIEDRLGALRGTLGPATWDATLARWFGDPVPLSDAAAAAAVRRMLEDIDVVGYSRAYRVFARSDAVHRERLGALHRPALFITGADDPNSSPAMSRAMAALAPQGRVSVVDGARHMMSLTSAASINRALLDFFRDVDAAAPRRAVDRTEFRKALGSFVTGVTVVATRQDDGQPRGFTANSFTSVSLDPPLVLICISKAAASHAVFAAAAHFSVNILAEAQADVSSLFASKAADKFAQVGWRRGPDGSPLLEGCAAWFECRRHDLADAGDHLVLIGEVCAFEHTAANPLGYYRGAHVRFGLSIDALASSGGRTRVGVILEHAGAVLFVRGADGLYDLPVGVALGADGDTASLLGSLRQLGIHANLSFLFAVFESLQRGPGAMSIYYRGTLQSTPSVRAAAPLIAFDAIPWEKLRDAPVAGMLRRYVAERSEDTFGVYVGDADRGRVQSLARTAGPRLQEDVSR